MLFLLCQQRKGWKVFRIGTVRYVCACVTGLQHSALYRFGRFAERVILKSVRRRTATDLSRTIAGDADNAGTTAHAGTSVLALGWQL